MMYLYLFENSGTFVCEVKKNNIASINMCERIILFSIKKNKKPIFIN